MKIRDYPRLSLTARPATKAMLDAIAMIEKRPAWKVVEDALKLYAEQLPVKDRRLVGSIVERTGD